MWYNSLNRDLEESVLTPDHRKVPDQVLGRLYHLQLGILNTTSDLTLRMLHVMADTAVAMAADMTPNAQQIMSLMAQKTPQAYMEATALLHDFTDDDDQATIHARHCAASLIPATRDVRTPGGRDEGAIAEMPTAVAVAMWTAVYWQHRARLGAERSDGFTALMLSSLRG